MSISEPGIGNTAAKQISETLSWIMKIRIGVQILPDYKETTHKVRFHW